MHSINPPRMDGIEGKACMAPESEVDARLESLLPTSGPLIGVDESMSQPVPFYPNQIETAMRYKSSIISLEWSSVR